MALIVRGNPITLDLLSFDGNNVAVDVPDLKASIKNPAGVTVVTLDATVFVSTGHRQYVFAVPADAPLGAWVVQWDGTIDGGAVTTSEGFTVVASGSFVTTGRGSTTCSPWATSEDAPAAILALEDVDLDAVDVAFAIASDILYDLSGRIYPGLCSDVIRPQAQWAPIEYGSWLRNLPAQYATAFGWCACHRGRETGCASVPEIKLPGHPVQRATIVVKIDGDVFDAWELHDGRYLVRTDGNGWPCCQDMRLPDTELRTFSISYGYGRGPDLGGVQACALLGSSFYLDFNPQFRSACGSIPKRATNVVRQGISIQLKTVKDMIAAGSTGLDFVDLWLNSKKVGKSMRPSTVMSPATRRGRSARRIGR